MSRTFHPPLVFAEYRMEWYEWMGMDSRGVVVARGKCGIIFFYRLEFIMWTGKIEYTRTWKDIVCSIDRLLLLLLLNWMILIDKIVTSTNIVCYPHTLWAIIFVSTKVELIIINLWFLSIENDCLVDWIHMYIKYEEYMYICNLIERFIIWSTQLDNYVKLKKKILSRKILRGYIPITTRSLILQTFIYASSSQSPYKYIIFLLWFINKNTIYRVLFIVFRLIQSFI